MGGVESLKRWRGYLLDLLYPRSCLVCGKRLGRGEEILCLHCYYAIPRTQFHRIRGNTLEQLFYGKIPIEQAVAWFGFARGSRYRYLIHRIKYSRDTTLAEALGHTYAMELRAEGALRGIEGVVALPLHPLRALQRGYNQSYWIARGVARGLGVPLIKGGVRRVHNNETQTHKDVYHRWLNVRSLFRVTRPERFRGKHLLLVDDVVTTGATLATCGEALLAVEGVRLSLLALVVAER